MMRLATVFAAVSMAGCASSPPPSDAGAMPHTRAPVAYESTVSSYFDLTGAPIHRKLAFGVPESSKCPLRGSGGGGVHLGWVVPVVYDTTPGSSAVSKSSAGATKATVAKATKATTGVRVASSGTAADAVALEEIEITGARYFFWFSSETLSAVTRRGDVCP